MVSKVNQLPLLQFTGINTSIMVLLVTISSLFQSLPGPITSYLKLLLVLLDPGFYSSFSQLLDSTQEEIHWQMQFLSKHKEKEGLTSGLVYGGIVCEYDLGQIPGPMLFLFNG